MLRSLLFSSGLAVAVPLAQGSIVAAVYSGVFTGTKRCGAWYVFNSCSEGYECINYSCVPIPALEAVPAIDEIPSPEETSEETDERIEVRFSCPEFGSWNEEQNRCVCNSGFEWNQDLEQCRWVEPEPDPEPQWQPDPEPQWQPDPEPVWVPPQSNWGQTDFSFYDPTTGGGACDGIRHNGEFIVEIATDLYQGGSRCGSTVNLRVPGGRLCPQLLWICAMWPTDVIQEL